MKERALHHTSSHSVEEAAKSHSVEEVAKYMKTFVAEGQQRQFSAKAITLILHAMIDVLLHSDDFGMGQTSKTSFLLCLCSSRCECEILARCSLNVLQNRTASFEH